MIRYHVDCWVSDRNLDRQAIPSTNLHGDYDLCWCKDCRFAWYAKDGWNFDKVPNWFKPHISIDEFIENPSMFAVMCRALELSDLSDRNH